jgi:cation:H+ antiporter
LSPNLLIWLYFAACVALIGLAGPELCRSGDVIAEKTGLSRNWIGLVLIASVTSLPELVIGASSVTIANTPDIAVGDAFGSCVFNLVMLVVLDFLQRGENVYRRARVGHVVSAGFGVVLIGFTGMSLLVHGRGIDLPIGHIGGSTPIILLLYALAMRAVFTYEREHREEFVEELAERYRDMTLRRAALRYAIGAAVIVAAGVWLPFVADRLAQTMGWRTSFVGTLFVAGATSLPELVVTVSALRIGALDMAVANLLGSNLFDMAIIAIDDLLYANGPILSRVSPIHGVSAMSAVVMTGIVIVGLLYRPRRRVFRAVGWISLGLFVMYLLNSYVLYVHGE